MTEGKILYPGRDGIAPLEFRTSATRITFELNLMEGGWSSTRQQLLQVFDSKLEMYELLLGDESKLTDTRAQYVIYVEPEQAEIARTIIEYLTNG